MMPLATLTAAMLCPGGY